jgi:methionine-gamma-lyase
MVGPGAMLAFEVAGGHDTAARVMRAVRLITPAVSLGCTDSLIEHPAGLTHRLVDPEARLAAGITPGLLRLGRARGRGGSLGRPEQALASATRWLAAP